jgi:hypothetical protein
MVSYILHTGFCLYFLAAHHSPRSTPPVAMNKRFLIIIEIGHGFSAGE